MKSILQDFVSGKLAMGNPNLFTSETEKRGRNNAEQRINVTLSKETESLVGGNKVRRSRRRSRFYSFPTLPSLESPPDLCPGDMVDPEPSTEGF